MIKQWVTLFVDLESGCWEEYFDGEEEWVSVVRKEGGKKGKDEGKDEGKTWDEDRDELR